MRSRQRMDEHAKGKGDKSGREHARYDVDWRVSVNCASWATAAKVAASNASRGGIFLLTPKPPPRGSAVELTIQLPDGSKLAVRGTVAHVVTAAEAASTGRAAGVGIKLDAKHEADLLLMEQMAMFSSDAGNAMAAIPAPADEPPNEHGEDYASTPAPVPVPRAEPTTPGPVPIPTPATAARALPTGVPIAPALGIDFGTSYTSVSVALGDRVYLIPDEQGRTLQPSIVHYPRVGGPIVGWPAREYLARDPRRTIASAKRLLGKSWSDAGIAGYLQSLAYKTVGGPNDSVLIDLDGDQLAVAQVCAQVIGHLRDLAERRLGQRFKQVAMTVPVSFTEQERAAVRRAAQLAGLELIAFVQEPVAGAMAYGMGKGVNEIIAVYDFGGGTFDFSVLDVSNDRFRVLATEGDSWLGGDDFDLAIAGAVADAFWRATKIEIRQRLVEWQRLLLACEQAKRDLSSATESRIVVEGLVEQPKRIDLRQRIDRPLFERLCRELFDRSTELCGVALARAGLEPEDVTQVVVTGGISRVPMVRDGLARYFGREVRAVINPEEAIALGAGIVAAKTVKHEVVAAVSSPT